MNRIYRTVFNATTGKMVVASELAKGRQKSSKRAAVLTAAMTAAVVLTASHAEAADYSAGNATAGNTNYGCTVASTPLLPAGCSPSNNFSITVYGTAVGESARATAGTAFGDHATSTGGLGTAIGNYSYAAYSGTAVGTGAYAQGRYATAIGRNAYAATDSSVALGIGASATGADSVALGGSSLADRDSAVSVGAPGSRRQIINVAAGTADTDAVNVGQMNAGLSTTNASIAATNTALSTTNASLSTTNATLSTTNSSLSTTNATLSTANSQIASLQGDMTAAKTGISTNTSDITKLNDKLGELSSGTIGLVQQLNTGDDLTVGADTDGAAVNFAGKSGERKLSGIAAGTAETDAVNVGQMNAGLSTANAAIAATNAELSSTNTQLGALDADLTTAQTNIATHTTEITSINDKLSELSSGTVGLVQQLNPGDDLTVGASTDGTAVNFAGKSGERKLSGIAAGTADTDAVNVGQMNAGLSTTNAAITSLDGRVTINEGAITKLADQIGSGTLGLVQQLNTGDDLTVGADTDGMAVNFAGKSGERKLSGIAAGALDSDAVNLGQMNAEFTKTNDAIAGLDGRVTDNETAITDLDGRMTNNETAITDLDGRVTNIDNRVTVNEGALTKLANEIGNGSVGLVQQDAMSGAITVAAATGGTSVNFTGADGARVLSGVANGVDDDDVVTVSQLRATGLIDYTGKEVGAVTYDSGLNFDTVTFAGTFGTKLQRVAAGEISATSMDAVNGSQLFDLQEQFAKQYGDLSGQLGDLSSRFGDLSDRLGDLEANPGTGGPGTGDGSTVVGEGAVASGENSSAIGDSALASGENASAVGQGAVASGNNGSAIGQGSVASGENGSALGQGAVASGENGTALGQGSAASGANGTAVGQGAVASGENSTSLGQGASATGSGSVAIGQGSVATEANTVSFGDGTAEGNRRLVNIADGINASDAATKGQLDRAMESVDARFNDTNRAINDVAKNAYAGIAAAMAMPNMTPSQPGKTVVAVGAANFKSGSAIAAGATYRSRNGNWLVNGATSITSVGDVGVRAQVGYEF
ncbi:TPA: YadA-like family protein [Burkholderia cenocepacia]|nr:YadA-like family protein [Burkholderia cenocepacia]HDR9812199.1 YadA-like family protein [Burkholderia cenocepacia]HDR9816423.1 YadA-like family protein [Burkholderia cenocepacia]HDR9829399.1 YadA-like family protein [Burkholderia cenocepacia]